MRRRDLLRPTTRHGGPHPRPRVVRVRRRDTDLLLLGPQLAMADHIPDLVWSEVARHLDPYDHIAFALTCRTFKRVLTEDVRGKKLRTDLRREKLFANPTCFTASWFRWVYKSFPRQPGRPRNFIFFLEIVHDCELLRLAAFQGSRESLKWLRLRTEGWDSDERVCADAALGGQLETLQWLRGEGLSWDWQSSASAAEGGHLDVLRWLRAAGCPWGEETSAFAAEGGHLGVLKWLRENGCPWNEYTCEAAAWGGHLHVLKWARANGCPWNKFEMIDFAAKGSYMEMLKYLRREGCTFDQGTAAIAARWGHISVLRWLRSEGCPLDLSSCEMAARWGHFQVLQWLRREDCPWNRKECRQEAMCMGHIQIATWIDSQES